MKYFCVLCNNEYSPSETRKYAIDNSFHYDFCMKSSKDRSPLTCSNRFSICSDIISHSLCKYCFLFYFTRNNQNKKYSSQIEQLTVSDFYKNTSIKDKTENVTIDIEEAETSNNSYFNLRTSNHDISQNLPDLDLDDNISLSCFENHDDNQTRMEK